MRHQRSAARSCLWLIYTRVLPDPHNLRPGSEAHVLVKIKGFLPGRARVAPRGPRSPPRPGSGARRDSRMRSVRVEKRFHQRGSAPAAIECFLFFLSQLPVVSRRSKALFPPCLAAGDQSQKSSPATTCCKSNSRKCEHFCSEFWEKSNQD